MSDEKRDGLGARMKNQYEHRTRYMLPRRTWTVIRCDGKAFHTFTRGCEKPHDPFLHTAMVDASIALCGEAQGAKFGYVQSDEISVILTDFDRIETQAWFDGNVQKIASVSSSVVTAAFNSAMHETTRRITRAHFDARVFTIPDPVEVDNYLIWRQKDAIRNSISGLAQVHFSPKQLDGKKQPDMLSMLSEIGVRWEYADAHIRHGTAIVYHGEDGWKADYVAPVFTEDRGYLRKHLPRGGEGSTE